MPIDKVAMAHILEKDPLTMTTHTNLGLVDCLFLAVNPRGDTASETISMKMKALERRMMPLVRQKELFERSKARYDHYYRSALESADRAAASKSDRALCDIAAALSDVIAKLLPLEREYRALQQSLVI